ncbi:hypothetical protein U9M48_044975 [Paspalum notatum var. saurae]|uniref:Uncharacterized protein n=1 Tax=Paspalum notatum var. saurae TaxID=547442 RepID=A0AAQ3V226_PASNO
MKGSGSRLWPPDDAADATRLGQSKRFTKNGRCFVQGSTWACLWFLYFVAGLLVGGAISNYRCPLPPGVANPSSIEASLPRWTSGGGGGGGW